MKDLTPLKSKNGESEWPYEGKTLIAVLWTSCKRCVFFKDTRCPSKRIDNLPDCVVDFKGLGLDSAMYIEKPAES